MMKDAALEYASKGWPIFPCKIDKTPYTTHGVNDATTNKEQVEKWWTTWPEANIGLDVGRLGMMVVDLDPGSDYDALDKAVGGLPETHLVQRTPRGGEHLFFELAEGEIVSPSASKLSPKVDVRSHNSYVLLAPSRTEAGTYAWEEQGRPAYRTDEMVRLANSHREKHEDRDKWLIEADLPENVALATEWLKHKARVAIEGQGGDQTAYATAAMMKSYGISEPHALELMVEHWNPRCNPPWSADEMEHLRAKVEHGYRYNTSPPGNMTPAYRVAKNAALFQAQGVALASGMEWTAGRFRVVDRAGMASIAPPEWIIKDLIPRDSYTILFGAFGSFKSFIALDIALHVAAGLVIPGASLWHDKIVNSGPVLFTAGEGRAGITKRVKAWEDVYYKAPVDSFFLGDPVPLIDEELEPFINAALAASPDGYELVVIDTIGRAMQGSDENAQKEASKFTALVDRLRKELGCSVIAIHHTGHNATDRERGSGVFGADADARLRVDRDGTEYRATLSVLKQKDAPEGEPRLIQLREHRLAIDEQSTLVAVKPDQSEAAASQLEGSKVGKRNKFDPGKHEDAGVLKLLDQAVEAVLASNKIKAWSQSALAEAVAMRPEIDVGSVRVRALLTRLREDKTTRAHHCYDATASGPKWRFAQS